jgi:hypothetical protein
VKSPTPAPSCRSSNRQTDGATNSWPPTHPARPRSSSRARHRPHARVEDNIRTGKDTGLGHLPSTSIDINRAWCLAATITCDLLAWLRLLCLDGPMAKAEPKTLRYRLLHTTARIVRGQRKRKIRIPGTWPWASQLQACFLAAFALPSPNPMLISNTLVPDPSTHPDLWNRRPPDATVGPTP